MGQWVFYIQGSKLTPNETTNPVLIRLSFTSKIVSFWHGVAHRWKCSAKCVNHYSWDAPSRSTGSDYSFLK